jgi:hypothetical protein
MGNPRKNAARKRKINRKMASILTSSINNGCLEAKKNESRSDHVQRVNNTYAQLAGYSRNS